jgi:CRP/FNR family transcriptional regulator, cyclic AMP receptor protein
MDFQNFFDYPGQETDDESRQLVFLPRLSPEGWGKLLARTGAQRFRAGDVVVRAGETQPALYIVASGSLEVVGEGRRSKERRMAVIEQGSVFGEQSFFDGLPRSATVRALSDGELRSLTPEAFEVLAAREPDLARMILLDLGRILSLRLRSTSALAARLAE